MLIVLKEKKKGGGRVFSLNATLNFEELSYTNLQSVICTSCEGIYKSAKGLNLCSNQVTAQ